MSTYQTPVMKGVYDLTAEDGKIAFWKQILPKKTIHYTAKDGSRQVLDFNEQYLADLAANKAVDSVGFLLADVDNRHTMDPERWRGNVVDWAIRDDQPDPDHNGLYGKIVFPTKEAAKAVLDNPDLGVSARIREDIPKADGSVVSRGIVHVLGTLDPQVTGMSGWQTADLSSTEDNVLDLTSETYEDGVMGTKKSVAEYTEADIEAMSEDELNEFLAAAVEEFDEGVLDDDEAKAKAAAAAAEAAKTKEPEMALSTEARNEIDLARAAGTEALRQLAETRWTTERENYLNAGVPPAALDLAMPVLNRPGDFVVDLSVTDGEDAEVNVAKIVRGLLDGLKGTVDLALESGHGGTFKPGDGEDPDNEALVLWDQQF